LAISVISPFVATMIPLVETMEKGLGAAAMLEPVWWLLALGAGRGGNARLTGSAAIMMVAGLGERAGHPVGFARSLSTSVPITLLRVAIATSLSICAISCRRHGGMAAMVYTDDPLRM
jgi:Na+/H+ antiporter NhaD/arsenite permease-like protein